MTGSLQDVSIHAEYTSCEQMVREAAEYCKEKGKRMHVHLSETAKEHNECKANRGVTPAASLLIAVCLITPLRQPIACGLRGRTLTFLRNMESLRLIALQQYETCSGVANLKKMLKMGINVGIGTDGAASNNNLNMLEEVNLAALIQKGVNHDPLFLSQKELLKMSNAQCARSQGRMDCGAIK